MTSRMVHTSQSRDLSSVRWIFQQNLIFWLNYKTIHAFPGKKITPTETLGRYVHCYQVVD